MNNYLGDFAEDADVYCVFDTADSTGLSITATIAVADIEVYRQNTGAINLVQRSSTAGFTLDVDHDAMTGTHMVAIDTSDNTDAGFFAIGYDYFVKLNTITVDSISISKWIGHFSIENRYNDRNVISINGSTTAATQLALSAAQIENGACEGTPSTTVIQTDLAETQDDIYIGRTVIFTSGNARGEATDITDYTGATGTITVTALANAPAASDTFILI